MAADLIPVAWPDDDRTLEMSAPDLAAIPAVRRAASAHLERCGCHDVEGAVLVLSELVTNAVLHGGGADRIVVACDHSWVLVRVADGADEPACTRQERPAVGGRGLHIVEHLASRWGSTPRPGGKEVWAVVSADAPEATNRSLSG